MIIFLTMIIITESIYCDDILFLGPYVTLTIQFATPDTVKDSDIFAFFSPIRRFIFTCISNCSDTTKDGQWMTLEFAVLWQKRK